jgi:hypothetical protein
MTDLRHIIKLEIQGIKHRGRHKEIFYVEQLEELDRKPAGSRVPARP